MIDGSVQVVDGAIDLGRIGDTLLDGIIRFVKTDGATPLAGAEFELSGNGIAPRTAISDTSGAVAFAGVPYSNDPYTVSEMKTPADYYQKIADFQVTLNDASADADRVLQLPDVVDTPLGSITLTKKDATGVSVLPGATFELVDAQGGTVQTQTTDQDGKLTFADVALNPVGDTLCTLHETSAPADYALAPDQTVKLSNANGSRVVKTTVSDALKIATIQLLKVDRSGTPLQGATFTLYDASLRVQVLVDGHAVSATSGADGLVRLMDIPYGDYELVETIPPGGYAAVDPIAVSLHDGASCLSNGVFDLGSVQDTLVSTTLSQNGMAPKTGDVLAGPWTLAILATMGLVGIAMLCVAVGWARKGKKNR